MFKFLLIAMLSLSALAQELPQPLGRHGRGRLLNAWQLPASGEGYVRLYPNRNRGWGTQTMIDLIEKVALEMGQLFPMRDRVQIGDISSIRGGKISRHNSHQNGLDVDLAYFRLNGKEQSAGHRRGFQEVFVRKGRLTANFDLQRNWEFVKALHRHGKVTRIFVDRVIKRAFCDYAESLGENELHQDVLRSIRPYPHHHNHLHVRIACPDYATNCVNQPAPTGATGC